MQYFRIGPTPWLRTSHPASVSIGDPQFPSWTSSQGKAGLRSTLALIPEVDVVGKHQVDVLVVLAGEHGIAAVDLPREDGHAFVFARPDRSG